jgi:hypothetical protein
VPVYKNPDHIFLDFFSAILCYVHYQFLLSLILKIRPTNKKYVYLVTYLFFYMMEYHHFGKYGFVIECTAT